VAGVLVRVLKVGLDGTDRDINYDSIGMQDFTADDVYFEHGISRAPRLPYRALRGHARIPDQDPGRAEGRRRAAGAGHRGREGHQPGRRDPAPPAPLAPQAHVRPRGRAPGVIATLLGRLRGLEVTTFGLADPPYLNAALVEATGATYVSTKRTPLASAAAERGAPDLVFEATGFSPLVFEAMGVLARNGVLVLASVTGGDRVVEVPADRLNLGFVLGNKVMVGTVNAGRENFESGVRDLAMAEAQWPGWLERLLTHRVEGLSGCPKALELLGAPGVIKVCVEVAPVD
jgi:glucose 1-dehydrogenase